MDFSQYIGKSFICDTGKNLHSGVFVCTKTQRTPLLKKNQVDQNPTIGNCTENYNDFLES